jgi:hypothetical protein
MSQAPPDSLSSADRSARRTVHAALAALAGALLVLLLAAPAARADVGTTIILRCTHGQSLSGFTQQDYRRALAELPTEVEEYSDCANLIRHAQLAAAGGGSTGGPAGGASASAIPVTPVERRALQRLHRSGGAPVRVGGGTVRPGVVHASVASALSTLPTPLLALLAFLIACGLLLLASTIRDRVRARRTS